MKPSKQTINNHLFIFCTLDAMWEDRVFSCEDDSIQLEWWMNWNIDQPDFEENLLIKLMELLE